MVQNGTLAKRLTRLIGNLPSENDRFGELINQNGAVFHFSEGQFLSNLAEHVFLDKIQCASFVDHWWLDYETHEGTAAQTPVARPYLNLKVNFCYIGEIALNDEPVSDEDNPSPSVSEEPAASQTRPLNTSFKVREPSERLGRKEKSAIQKFLPPVLGGLAALPLATAILWYGFGKDIGGIGPAVAQYAPWIVPKKLRGSGFRSDGTFSSSNSGGSSNSDYGMGTVPDISSKQMPADGFKSTLPSLGSMSPPANSRELAPPKSDDVADSAWAEKPESNASPSVAIDKLSKSIEDLVDLKEKWPSIPRERAVQLKAVSDFYGFLCEIAKWSDSPDDGISELWNQHRGSIASMILEDNKFSALTQRCATGEIADVVSLEANGYLVTVIPSGFPMKEKESADGEKNLTLETVIAGHPMTAEFPSSDEELANKVKIIEPGRPVLLLLRVEKQAEAVTLTVFDCMSSPPK